LGVFVFFGFEKNFVWLRVLWGARGEGWGSKGGWGGGLKSATTTTEGKRRGKNDILQESRGNNFIRNLVSLDNRYLQIKVVKRE